MEKTPQHTEKLETVTKQSNLSTFLNGVGSGAMVTGALTYAAQFVGKAINPKFSIPQFERTLVFTSVLGAAAGAVYSFKEARHLNEYRESLAKDIENLHAKVERLEAQHGR